MIIRVTISVQPEDLTIIDEVARVLGMNRSEAVSWVFRTTRDFIVTPDIEKEYAKQFKKVGVIRDRRDDRKKKKP
jgi:hypothetical protein